MTAPTTSSLCSRGLLAGCWQNGTASAYTPRCVTSRPHHMGTRVAGYLSHGAYVLRTCHLVHALDVPLARKLAALLAGERVLELGAGCGCYTAHLQAAGVQVVALDGTTNIGALTGGLVERQDATEAFLPSTTFGWVLSLEVGEHIRRRLEPRFLCALVQHAESGVALSWAVPAQGGNNHVNEQTNGYVISRMAAHGWAHDNATSTALRAAASFHWFKRTIMAFRPSGRAGTRALVAARCTSSLRSGDRA